MIHADHSGLVELVHPGQRLALNTLRVMVSRSPDLRGLFDRALASPEALDSALLGDPGVRSIAYRTLDGMWFRRRWSDQERRSMVVDLSNVVWTCKPADRQSGLRLAACFPLLARLSGFGIRIVSAVADASLRHQLDDPERWPDISSFAQTVEVVPAGEPADALILERSQEHRALILSNDRFRDWRSRSGWAKRNANRLRVPVVAPLGFGEAESELSAPPGPPPQRVGRTQTLADGVATPR